MLRKALTAKNIVLVLNPLFLFLIAQKYIDYRYEEAIYVTIVSRNKVVNDDLATLKNLVQTTFDLTERRREYIGDMDGMNPLKIRLYRSGDVQLLDGRGSCGNTAHILAELCQTAGFPVRIVQLSTDGRYGSHIIVESFVCGNWIAADALFRMLYLNPDSTYASMEDLRSKPDYFLKALPADYPYKNSFREYRYTNWEKIPILMPALRKVLVAVKGEEWTSELSLRSFFLNMHRSIFYFLIICYIPVLVLTLMLMWTPLRASQRQNHIGGENTPPA